MIVLAARLMAQDVALDPARLTYGAGLFRALVFGAFIGVARAAIFWAIAARRPGVSEEEP